MADLEFVDQHNMVACLEKTGGNSEFHEIVDFLTSSLIHHALTVSPTIYISYIEQFWNTASSQTVNDEKQIHATVDSKAVVVTEASIRSSLLLNDADGTACLTNEAIFQNLALMGYEGELNKLTFQKALFSPQWKYLIHTILHCLSSKSTSWNEFSTNIASAVICLATNQKFNFSKLIFDGMLRNLDTSKKKFLMYPRFLMVFLNNQIELGEPFNDVYVTPAHTQKVFSNMSRKGVKFSGKVTLLFDFMLVPHQAPEGEGSEQPTEPQPTPSPTQPIIRDQPPGTNGSEEDQVQPSHDSLLSGGPTSDRAKGGITLEELSVLCTNLSNRVLALEASKDAQAAKIIKLKAESRSYKRRGRKNAKPGPTLDDSTFDDLDADHGMDYMDTEEPVNEGRLRVVLIGSRAEVSKTSIEAELTYIGKGKGRKDKTRQASEETACSREISSYQEQTSNKNSTEKPNMTTDKQQVDIKCSAKQKGLLKRLQALTSRNKKELVPIDSAEEENLIKNMNEKATGEDTSNKEKVLEEPDSTKVEVKQEGNTESTKKRPADESSRYIKTFIEIVSKFDRLDFIELHSLVMKRFETSTPKGIDLIIWGSLRTMFEANAEDDLWKNQEEWILKSWNFYYNCGVHILVLEDGTEFYMLAERRYPFTKETLERMLALRLIAESESEAVFDLLRFIQKQINESGSHDGSEKDL
ncbi:hypothetical protein Tco_1121448 [Tanacetum coccineum]|uniref:Uncharacterized protein n=1 Tax=Tanacetum coccineum TaxID=301880 RepID=A0ABQ5IXQ9_9ASTR